MTDEDRRRLIQKEDRKFYGEWIKKWCSSIYVKIAVIGFPFASTSQEMLAGNDIPILNFLLTVYSTVFCIATGGTVVQPLSMTMDSTGPSGGGGSGKVGEATIDGQTFDLYRHSVIPYSRVEKAADQISAAVNHQQGLGFPAVIAESRDAYQAVSAVLGGSVSSALDTLDVLEETLRI